VLSPPWVLYVSWRLIYAPWGSFMLLGTQVRMPPPYACVPWVLLRPLRLIYVHWGLIYAPWGSFMPPGAQVRAPPLKCACPRYACTPPQPIRTSFQPCVPLPSHLCLPLAVCAPPCRAHPHLPRLRLLDLFKVLPWKSTSPLSMPCQPTILTGGKM
jgi:hypothetical protein